MPDDDHLTVTGIQVPACLRYTETPDSLPPGTSYEDRNLAWVKWSARASASTAESLHRFVVDQREKHARADAAQSRLETTVGGLQAAVGGLQSSVASLQLAIGKGATKLTVGAVLMAAIAAGVPKVCEAVASRLGSPVATGGK